LHSSQSAFIWGPLAVLNRSNGNILCAFQCIFSLVHATFFTDSTIINLVSFDLYSINRIGHFNIMNPWSFRANLVD